MARGAGADASALAWTWVETALGRWLLAADAAGLCFLALDPLAGPPALRLWAARALPGARPCERSTPLLAAAQEQLGEYAAGRRRAFDLRLDLRGTPFQRAVWGQLGLIPYGRTRTYGDLAARLGKPGAARAVGLAAGRNPLPVIVPCHRLVAADGLGGFSAGRDWKRRLLAVEGVRLPAQGILDLDSSRSPRPRE